MQRVLFIHKGRSTICSFEESGFAFAGADRRGCAGCIGGVDGCAGCRADRAVESAIQQTMPMTETMPMTGTMPMNHAMPETPALRVRGGMALMMANMAEMEDDGA